jgi:C-terminal processing protease CtpA/Prc
MMGIAALGVVLLAPAAPVPAPPPVQAPNADRFKAQEFARVVYQTAAGVQARYAKPVEIKELIEAAVRGLYEECGLEVPERVEAAVKRASGATELVETLTDVRLLLANQPALNGPRALFAAINGFKHATEPVCQLVSPRANTFASIDMDFGIGLELEGVSGPKWIIYQVEYKTALGHYPPTGWLGPVPKPDAVAAPASIPWRVKRVIPESPAQKAGVKPGDVITHLNGTEVTAENVNKLFAQFAFPPQQAFDPRTGMPLPPDRTLTFKRGEGKPFSVPIKGTPYTPASAFGVMRTPEDKWDCMLDRQYKIGYIRVGAIEMGLDEKFGQMLADLEKKGCRGLILDLRWCPGGYVTPGERIAGQLLPPNAVIAHMKYRDPNSGRSGDVRNPFAGTRYTDVPLVVLVGQETTGGGELIASALRDNDRCVLLGQRTVGRASIQNIIDGGFGGLQFKVSVGESFRPNGKSRQRKPDSGPNDEWGLKPDEGLEVPVTKDKSAELRRWAELHSLRPADSNEALDFDDPLKDPYRLKALDYLRKKLGKK